MYQFKECGLDNIYLKNGYEVYESSEGTCYGVRDLDKLHQVIAKGLVKKPAPLTGKEFRFLRIELNLSQKAVGDLMEKSEQTIANWEKGDEPINRLADSAIRNYYLHSVGESEIAGLLEKLAHLDQLIHGYQIRLEETQDGWQLQDCA